MPVFYGCVFLSVALLSVEGALPAEALYFVPGEFGLQLSMCQSNDPEALPGVGLQSLCEALWDCAQREKKGRVSVAVFRMNVLTKLFRDLL